MIVEIVYTAPSLAGVDRRVLALARALARHEQSEAFRLDDAGGYAWYAVILAAMDALAADLRRAQLGADNLATAVILNRLRRKP